jgi:putative Mn2+ efflux pump MntP
MSLGTTLALAVALGTDALAVCLGIGMGGVTRRQVVVISAVVLVFHIVMPLVGWLTGEMVGQILGRVAGIAGALLLIYLGARMIFGDGASAKEALAWLKQRTGVVALGAGVSVDALSAGFALGTQATTVWPVVSVIGLVAGAMTCAGLLGGRFISLSFGERARRLGGLVLLAIGGRFLVGG